MIFAKEKTRSFIKLHYDLAIVFLIVIVGFLVRYLFLDFNPIGLDEPFSVYHAQLPLSDIIENMKGGNNPPFYEIFLHFWIKLFGIEPPIVRLPSVLFGVANIIIVYGLTKKFFSLRVAILATLLLAFSSLHFYFSQEARVYSLFTLLTSLTFYYLFSIIKYSGKQQSNFIFLFLAYVFLVYAHYLGFFVIFIQGTVVILIRSVNKEIKRRFAFVLVGLFIAFIPYILEFSSRFFQSAISGTWLKEVENLGNLHDYIFAVCNYNKWIYLLGIIILWGCSWVYFYKSDLHKKLKFVILLFIIPLLFLTSYSIFFKIPFLWKLTSSKLYIGTYIALIIVGLSYAIKQKINNNTVVVLLWSVFSLLFIFASSFFVPMFISRYLIFILPAFYILLAIAVNYLFKGRVYYIAALILVALMIINVNLKRDDNKGIIETVNIVKELKEAKTKVIIIPSQYKLTFLYHYDKDLFKITEGLIDSIQKKNIYPAYKYSEFKPHLEANDSSLILLDANSKFLYPNNGILDSLKYKYVIKEQFEFKEKLVVYKLILKDSKLKSNAK